MNSYKKLKEKNRELQDINDRLLFYIRATQDYHPYPVDKNKIAKDLKVDNIITKVNEDN